MNNYVAYVVQQGDYLTKLAFRHGFNLDEVWNHPKNAEVKAACDDNHNILAPGDILYIPVREERRLPLKAGTSNTYVATVPKVAVSLVLRSGDQALAGEPFTIEGLRTPMTGQTSADGSLKFEAPVDVREVQLTLPQRNTVHSVFIGDMDPVSKSSGVFKRLAHLGHLVWRPELEVDSNDLLEAEGPLDLVARLRAAGGSDRTALERGVAAFQSAQGLGVNGDLDEATLEALTVAHGQ